MGYLQTVLSSFRHLLLVIGSLVIKSLSHWSLVIGCWKPGFKHLKWLLASSSALLVHRSSFIVHRSSLLVLLAFLASCARQGTLVGGPKDTRPPEVDTTASTPNYATRFDQKRIELKFDEWVVLSDAISQVVVSPPLAKRPEVILKGRTVVVNFDQNEVLRSNTTYTVNFGTSVKDLHEGNPAKDLRFVFSTGDFIDSLFFKGVLTDAFTGEPVENVSIMLYESFADSALRRERPYYFSRTDKVGQYEFKNLRADTFRVVAIEESLQDLKWDGENERIAFRDSALIVSDSLRGSINLKLFKNRPKFRLMGTNANRFGLVRLGFNTPIDSFDIQTLAPDNLKTLTEKTPDSLLLWYDLPQDTAWSLKFSRTGVDKSDTIRVKNLSRSDFLKNHRLGFGDVAQPAAPAPARGKSLGTPAPAPKPPAVKTIQQVFSQPAALPFNFPITSFDTSRWVLVVDSSRVTNFEVQPDAAGPRKLVMAHDWKQGKNYSLTLLPGAFTDFWGVTNADTLMRNFSVLLEKQLGDLTLNLDKIRPGISYVLQLLDGTTVMAETRFVSESSDKKLIFKHLQVATYTARLLEDLNGNGRWDTGDIGARLQPEQIYTKKLEPLRANWDLDASFSTEPINEKKRKQ